MLIENNIFNLNLIINSAKSLDCLVDLTVDDILNEEELEIDNLFIEILKKIILKEISIKNYPQLLRLKGDKEEIETMLTFEPEELLKRWFNYHLLQAEHPDKITYSPGDFKDSEKYITLLNQLFPLNCDLLSFKNKNIEKRAEIVLENAKKNGVNVYITIKDIIDENEVMNIFFIAEIFHVSHGLGNPTHQEQLKVQELLEDDEEGKREERSFKTWINSLELEGIKKVNNLYQESRTAVLLLKIIDEIKPGTVNWEIVEMKKTKNPFKIAVNCQEVNNSSKRIGFSIISIGNKDIQDGKKKHILALVWQMMKAYTLKKIGEKSEEELIAWANEQVSEIRRIKNLKEKKLNDGLFWIELLSTIKPKCVDWNLVNKNCLNDRDREMNSKYAISVAKGLGANVFLFWQDITEVKSKLLLTFLAAIYSITLKKK